MKYLGSKTLFVLFISFITMVLFLLEPTMSLLWFKSFNSEVLFSAGVFATLSSAGVYYFWKFQDGSEYRFGVIYNVEVPSEDLELFRIQDFVFVRSHNDGSLHYEIPQWAHKCLLFASALSLALLTMNNRGLQLLLSFDDWFKTPESHFCQEDEEEEESPEKAGCDLILKAWQMGYVKELGTCAPDEEEEILQAICRKRQKDEPVLHYSYRKLVYAVDFLRRYLGDDFDQRQSQRFERQFLDLQTLGDQQILALTNKPRSAHHIWTNLPNPKGLWGEVLEFLGGGNDCLEEWSDMKPVLPIDKDDQYAKAQTYEHSFGHMLFNSSHQTGVGYCREYKIHWGAPKDACDQLAEDPEEFLSSYNASAGIKNVLRRYRNRGTLEQLRDDLKEFDTKPSQEFQRLQAMLETVSDDDDKAKDKEALKPREVDQAVSFQCIVLDDEAQSKKERVIYEREGFPVYTIAFKGDHLKVEAENRFHPTPLRQLGPSLLPDFSYGQWMSRERPDLESAKEGIQLRLSESGDLMFTRLEYLRNADIVLGHKWINQREDLLSVYPWYLHLHHYVKIFRERYREERGRL